MHLFTRRDFLAASMAAVAGPVTARGLSQPPPAPVFTDLRRGVGMFTARGGAIGFLVNSGGALAIDSQYPDTAPLFLQGFKARTPRSLSLILNTHHHADHTGGNQVFKAAGTRIVGHANCLEWHKRASATAGTDTQQAYADTTFTDQWRTEFGDEVVQARHYGPGHTGGDAVIHLEKANVVHMGDLLFHRAHPNIDRPSGARIANWIQLLEQVAAAHAADTIFIAGHARDNAVQCTKAEIGRFRDYLTASLETTRKALAAGKSRDEIAATTSLPGFEDTIALNARLTQGFVLGVCWDELTGG